MLRRGALVVAVWAPLALVTCGGDGSTDATQPLGNRSKSVAQIPNLPPPKRSDSSSAEAIATRPEPKVTVPNGPPPKQLLVGDLIEGIGAVAKEGDELAVRYLGVNYKTRKEFENSWDATFRFELGSGFVNVGWERGLVGMKAGGQRELIVPPDLAPFGEDTLIYVVNLLAVNKRRAPSGP